MHLNLASILLALSAKVIALSANQLCGDSKDCAGACEQGRYHIVTGNGPNGVSFFGCSFATPQRDYRVAYCLRINSPKTWIALQRLRKYVVPQREHHVGTSSMDALSKSIRFLPIRHHAEMREVWVA